jgi:1,4-alpha-glucan branching enzyme
MPAGHCEAARSVLDGPEHGAGLAGRAGSHAARPLASARAPSGNVNDRIANVAGPGRGLRLAKVAAAPTLLGRGIPFWFMGAESGEHEQFRFGSDAALDLDRYEAVADLGRVREWWRRLALLRLGNDNIKGPAPLEVRIQEHQTLAFQRGMRGDLFVFLNFGGWSGRVPLTEAIFPDGSYREVWNSSWPAFAIQGEGEDECTNGGRDARIGRGSQLHVPDHGVVVLERI